MLYKHFVFPSFNVSIVSDSAGRSPPAPQQLAADTEIINKKVFFYSRTGGLYMIQRRGWTAQQMIQ
jgi:hypothetical protein